jgi:predicted nuclease with TOPRIM domain
VKELDLRIVDLETKSYAVSPTPARSRRLESRIDELTTKLNQESNEKTETMKMQRDADKGFREVQLQLTESERQRLKLQEEVRGYESKVLGLRQSIDQLVRTEALIPSSRADGLHSKTQRVTCSWGGAEPSENRPNTSKERWRKYSSCLVSVSPARILISRQI